ncbi:hypothetical protein GCM10007301_06550 [Azorhizobium oxalatiphilum]|uniref:Uncharacterized protein n=1 Tax=Azorhizobium oxalatiphilum TaxID=980631 RepID=A0A917BPZ1_9HYPH|nr:hypothetical protein GCM10007301_06550 [Azorhizobium oxalatiphilum]
MESKPTCQSNDDYLVIHRESALGPGSDILIRRKAPGADIACVYRKAPGDQEIKGAQDADYVLGLAGRFLVMDRGTGPSRKLVLWDIPANKAALALDYDDSVPVKVEPTVITFSEITGPATAKTCARWKDVTKDGLTAVLAVNTRITVPALTRSHTGATRCIAQQ